ncbi:MAG: DEAD/DEAH box helicase [Prevotella sp.]|nr:DEAD/DEAH box helicase [Prevotella sp.]
MSPQQQRLLTIFTLFDTEGQQVGRTREVLEKLSGEPCTDLKFLLKSLVDAGLLTQYDYNWRSDNYEYRIADRLMVPTMISLVKDTPSQTIDVLKAAAGILKPTYMQRLLWKYISSDYQDVNIEEIDDYQLSHHYDILVEVVPNPDFASLLLLLNHNTFVTLMEYAMKNIFDNQLSVNVAYLRQLLNRYSGQDRHPEFHTLLAFNHSIDLYDYLSNGTMPATLYPDVSAHRFIAAIHEELNGHEPLAQDHFKRAVMRNHSFARHFPYIIENFLFVLGCYRSGTEEGRKRSLIVAKSLERQATMAGKVLHGILFHSMTERQVKVNLSNLLTSEHLMDRVLAKQMYEFLHVTPDVTEFSDIQPKWHIFSQKALLFDLPPVPETATVQRPTRIAYFMPDMRSRDVERREQTQLKDGRWGAGKRMPGGRMSVEAVLPQMVKESRLYVGRYSPYTLVQVTQEVPYVNILHDRNGYHIHSNVPGEALTQTAFIINRGLADISFISLTDEEKTLFARLFSKEHYAENERQRLKSLLTEIDGRIEIHSDLLPGGSTLPTAEGTATLIMQVRPSGRQHYLAEFFIRPIDGGRLHCVPGQGEEMVTDEQVIINEAGEEHRQRTRVRRRLADEAAVFSHFIEDNGLTGETEVELDTAELLSLLEYVQMNPAQIQCEWPEGAQLRVRRQGASASSWSGTIKKNDNGWFEIEGSVEVDQDHVLTMSQLLDLASQARGNYIQLSDGEFLALSDSLRRQLYQLSTIATRAHGKVQMSKFSAAVLSADLFDGEFQIEEDGELRALRKQIEESGSYCAPIPPTLHATLREYQKEGYYWMSRLNSWGAGALLADDMGLGKTIQTIAFLLSKADEGPTLVIAPASVAPNWRTEMEKFAPSLRVTMLNFESDRRAAIEKAKAGDVVVMTYMLLLSVKDIITKKQWKTICLDEAHIIKNRGAKTSAVAMRLKSDYRIMLTGTPVQNHLGELWNLFQFVNPGLLGTFEDFNRRFIQPIELLHDKEAQQSLDRLIKPFMLRRTKEKVAQELPEKEEIYQHVTLSADEIARYEAIRQRAESMLLQDLGSSVGVNTLAEITRLRMTACCPSKTQALLELLSTIVEGNSEAAVLVFSQFTTYLSQIREALAEAHIPYLYIDGSVPIKERQRLVTLFQGGDGSPAVFLISLKAGGLGLNLTRANYVIHTDPWWNPAIESQATDRAHRIGQRRAVTVYHLISSGTIEEKIQRLHKRKQDMVENILDSTDMSHKLTGEELLEMVKSPTPTFPKERET